MQWVIPVRTDVWVMVKESDRQVSLLSEMLGQDPNGIRLTLPKFLTRIRVIPAKTHVVCNFVKGHSRYRFESHVRGYFNTAPPCMVLAIPETVYSGEMRTAMRWAVQVPISYITDDEKAESGYTQSVDISMSGLQMVTSQSFETNRPMFIQIYLAEGTVSVIARVTWSTYRGGEARTGVRFVSVSSQSTRLLNKFLFFLEKSAVQHHPGAPLVE